MEAQFEFETERSVWSFNFDAMMCWRRPKIGEGPQAQRDHEGISYGELGKPRTFREILPYPGNGYFVGFDDITDKVSGRVIETRGAIPDHITESWG